MDGEGKGEGNASAGGHNDKGRQYHNNRRVMLLPYLQKLSKADKRAMRVSIFHNVMYRLIQYNDPVVYS